MPSGSVGATVPKRSGWSGEGTTAQVSRIGASACAAGAAPQQQSGRAKEKRRASPAFESIPPPSGRQAPVRWGPQGLEAVGNGQAACGFSVVCAAGAGAAAGAAAGLAAGALAAFFAGAFFAAFFAGALAAFF